MLRRQSPNFDKTSFLGGPSEMAARIRAFDWTDHPLGPPDSWPEALRAALGIALNSAFPTCIYWGSELRLLYNDSWSAIPGPRHPGCLGEPAAEVWSDIWHIIEPQFLQAITTGQGVFLQDQMLPMRRFGVEEETYWTYNFTPILLDDGSIGGIFNSGHETTRQVLQQRSTQLLLELSDVFRTVPRVEEVRAQALDLLGRHLAADRVGLRAWTDRGPTPSFAIIDQWVAEGVARISETDSYPSGAEDFWNDILDGHVIRLDGSDPNRSNVAPDILKALGCEAALAVPWVEEGVTTSILFVHSRRARHWTDLEIETVEAVLGRMMNLIERARAAERERLMNREINHRSRNLLSVVLAMVRLARVEAPDVMRNKLMDRIAALSRNNSLISEQSWQPVTLTQLMNQEFSPYASTERRLFTLNGPDVVLTSDASQAMGMVLHELVTNAAKYGALKGDGGHVEVDWTLSDDRRLRINWVETSCEHITGDGLSDPGFGSKLMQLMIERQLAGSMTRRLDSTGLTCIIDVPWEDARDLGQGPAG